MMKNQNNSTKDYDFSGWATRANIKCSDGRTILKDAFKQNDGQKVPLVWNHLHDDPDEVLGHAILENRDDGVYAYCKFNDTESGKTAKQLVHNGDVNQLSIYANKLKSNMGNVIHGCIREVSLVLAGANPGAYIDSVIVHGEGADAEEEAVIYTDEEIELQHSEESDSNKNKEEVKEKVEDKKEDKKEDIKEDKKEEKTVKDVFNTLNEEQKDAVYAIVGQIVEDQKDEKNNENEGEDTEMKHNVFENDNKDEVLQHSEIISDAIKEAKKYGSMKESFIEHAAAANIDDIEKLFPDAVNVNKEPYDLRENEDWVTNIMHAVKHTPFSRVKNTIGKVSEADARAKGYVKGNKKTDIKMAILNRVTTPTTVYIKETIDRDDVVDITDFDVIAWQKKNMRKNLDKELALAMLLGDGRIVSSEDKINEQNIRPVISDADLYTIKYTVTDGVDYDSTKANDSLAKGTIRGAIRARKQYKGSGHPTFYTTEDILTDLLLIEDTNGRVIYESEEKLAQALRVKEIVTISDMEAEAYKDIIGVIVNMNDYTAGADKGGSVNMFDDFDIDFNQMKYLMETRMSGALTLPYSAIVLKKEAQTPTDDPTADPDQEPAG